MSMTLIYITIVIVFALIFKKTHTKTNDKNFSRKEPRHLFPTNQAWSVGMVAKETDLKKARYILRKDRMDDSQQAFTVNFYKPSHCNENCINSNVNDLDEITFYIHFKKQILEDEMFLLRINNPEIHGHSIRVLGNTHQISDQKIKITEAIDSIPITVELSTLQMIRNQLLIQFYYQDLEYELFLEQQALKSYLDQRNKEILYKASSDVEQLLLVVATHQKNKEIEKNDLTHWQTLMNDLEKKEDTFIPLQKEYDQLSTEELNFKN